MNTEKIALVLFSVLFVCNALHIRGSIDDILENGLSGNFCLFFTRVVLFYFFYNNVFLIFISMNVKLMSNVIREIVRNVLIFLSTKLSYVASTLLIKHLPCKKGQALCQIARQQN